MGWSVRGIRAWTEIYLKGQCSPRRGLFLHSNSDYNNTKALHTALTATILTTTTLITTTLTATVLTTSTLTTTTLTATILTTTTLTTTTLIPLP